MIKVIYLYKYNNINRIITLIIVVNLVTSRRVKLRPIFVHNITIE